MDSVTLLTIICTLLLLSSAVWLFFSLRKRALDTVATHKDSAYSLHLLVIISSLLYVALVAFKALAVSKGINHSLQFSIGSAIAVVGFVYLILGLYFYTRTSLQSLAVVLFSLSAIFCLGLLSTDSSFTLSKNGWALYLHLLLSLCSYACLSVAALLTIIEPWQSRRIRLNPTKASKFLPSLEALDKETFQLILLGFGLLTIALLTGFFFLENISTQHLPHKVILSILSWFVFGALLLGRWKLGWRGKTAMRFALLGFFLLLLAYFGSKWVLEVLLNRSWN